MPHDGGRKTLRGKAVVEDGRGDAGEVEGIEYVGVVGEGLEGSCGGAEAGVCREVMSGVRTDVEGRRRVGCLDRRRGEGVLDESAAERGVRFGGVRCGSEVFGEGAVGKAVDALVVFLVKGEVRGGVAKEIRMALPVSVGVGARASAAWAQILEPGRGSRGLGQGRGYGAGGVGGVGAVEAVEGASEELAVGLPEHGCGVGDEVRVAEEFVGGEADVEELLWFRAGLVVAREEPDRVGDVFVVDVQGALASGCAEFGTDVSGECLPVLRHLDELDVGLWSVRGSSRCPGAEGVEDVGVGGRGLIGAFVGRAAGADDDADRGQDG